MVVGAGGPTRPALSIKITLLLLALSAPDLLRPGILSSRETRVIVAFRARCLSLALSLSPSLPLSLLMSKLTVIARVCISAG